MPRLTRERKMPNPIFQSYITMKIREFKKKFAKLSSSEICHSILTSSVGNMFRVERSNKGKPSIIDRHHFKYVANGESMSTGLF